MKEFILQIDQATQALMQQLSHPLLDSFFLWVTKLADPVPMILLAAGLIIYLALTKQWRQMFTADIALLSGLFLQYAFKWIFGRERPEGGLLEESTASFPSGHSTMSVIFFLLVLFFVRDDLERGPVKSVLLILCVLGMILVPISRIYLQVHWLSDIIAGAILGVVVVITSWRAGKRLVPTKE